MAGSSVEPVAASGLGRWLCTAGLMIATAMQAADALIVNIALPRLEKDLGAGIELGAWVLTSYLCATAVMAPLSGWLRRRYGAAPLFRASIVFFVGASLACAVAPSGPVIIGFRILQGAGAGLILPVAQAMLLDLYPKERHGRILASWGAVLMIGPVLGPLIGGVITDLVSWRGAFAINLPIGIAVILLVRGLPHREETERGMPIDLAGIVLLTIGVGALQLSLERAVGRSWLRSPELLTEVSLTVAAFAGLVLRARRAGFGIVKPDIFKDVNFSAAAFYNFMVSALLFITIVFVPALGEGSLGYTATLAGFTIVPRAVLMMLMMLWVGRLIGRLDCRIILGAGWVLMAAGLALLSVLPSERALAWIIFGTAVQGIGAGLLFTPHSTLAFSTLPGDLRTDASGVYSLMRQLGMASGVALMTAVWRELTGGHFAHIPVAANLLARAVELHGYRECFGIMAIVSLALIPGVFVFRQHGLQASARPVPDRSPRDLAPGLLDKGLAETDDRLPGGR